jgi:hypothetical protein
MRTLPSHVRPVRLICRAVDGRGWPLVESIRSRGRRLPSGGHVPQTQMMRRGSAPATRIEMRAHPHTPTGSSTTTDRHWLPLRLDACPYLSAGEAKRYQSNGLTRTVFGSAKAISNSQNFPTSNGALRSMCYEFRTPWPQSGALENTGEERTKRRLLAPAESIAFCPKRRSHWPFFVTEWATETIAQKVAGGGRGIRTPDTVARIHAFQACAFNHSATPPSGGADYNQRATLRKRVRPPPRPWLSSAGRPTTSDGRAETGRDPERGQGGSKGPPSPG